MKMILMKIISADKAKKIYESKKNNREKRLKSREKSRRKEAIARGIELLNEAVKNGEKSTTMTGPEDFLKDLKDIFQSKGYTAEIREIPSDKDTELVVSWI